jgi:hypothetical protein
MQPLVNYFARGVFSVYVQKIMPILTPGFLFTGEDFEFTTEGSKIE